MMIGASGEPLLLARKDVWGAQTVNRSLLLQCEPLDQLLKPRSDSSPPALTFVAAVLSAELLNQPPDLGVGLDLVLISDAVLPQEVEFDMISLQALHVADLHSPAQN